MLNLNALMCSLGAGTMRRACWRASPHSWAWSPRRRSWRQPHAYAPTAGTTTAAPCPGAASGSILNMAVMHGACDTLCLCEVHRMQCSPLLGVASLPPRKSYAEGLERRRLHCRQHAWINAAAGALEANLGGCGRCGAAREPMWEETAVLLRGFYAPFNAQLAAMLQDSRYAWQRA